MKTDLKRQLGARLTGGNGNGGPKESSVFPGSSLCALRFKSISRYHPPPPGFGGTGVMNRDDPREAIFQNDEDRQRLLAALGEAYVKTGWQRPLGKVAAARWLRQEITMSLNWIAERLHRGDWTCASNLLNGAPVEQTTQRLLALCQ